MENDMNATMKTKIVAIEEDALILLVSDSGDTIRWPLTHIPQPFEVSDDMALVLQNKSVPGLPAPGSKNKMSHPPSGPLSNDDKRKLLESLIN